MANRKATVARDETDNRPHMPGLYRKVLPVVCLREISRSPRFAYHGLRDLHDPQAVIEESEMEALAGQLAAERLADGIPIDAWWYDLPPGLPAPLDTLGHDPAPRRVTITADDRVDATKWQQGVIELYSRARHYSGCDHAYFRAAMNWPGEVPA